MYLHQSGMSRLNFNPAYIIKPDFSRLKCNLGLFALGGPVFEVGNRQVQEIAGKMRASAGNS